MASRSSPNLSEHKMRLPYVNPQWIAKVFPTYYVIQPVIGISQRGAGLADVAWQLGILLFLILAMGGVVWLFAQRTQTRV